MIEIVINAEENMLGGGVNVRRTLPYEKKKMVGPFIFFDHIGPVDINSNHELAVEAHPHIGLSTITYLFSGEILHRDNLGNEQLIKADEVNFMTAGKGVAHSERSRESSMDKVLEGIQVWIALPKEVEDVEPSFKHIDSGNIPLIPIGKNVFRLVAGRAFGKVSPVPVYSLLFYLVGDVGIEGIFSMDLAPQVEGAVYVVRGKLNCDHKIYNEGALICFQKGTSINFMATEDSRVVVFGGEVFPEKRFIWWNFVSSNEAKIEIAKMRWNNHQFEKVINEDEYVTLPKGAFTNKEEVVIYP